MDEITAYLPGLSPVENKELCVRFAGGRLSSDGGVLVLREIEKRLGLAARLAGCLSDARDPASTTHSYADMIGGAHVRHRLRIRGLRRPRRAALRSGVQAGLWSPARERSRSDVAADLVQARERPIMARTGAHGADDDRSVLRQLRARAPTHRARH